MSSFLPLALLHRRLHSLERRCLNDAAPSSLAQLIASRANHVLLSGRCPLFSYCPLPISLLNLPSSTGLDPNSYLLIACFKLEEYHTAKEALENGASLAQNDSGFTKLITE